MCGGVCGWRVLYLPTLRGVDLHRQNEVAFINELFVLVKRWLIWLARDTFTKQKKNKKNKRCMAWRFDFIIYTGAI